MPEETAWMYCHNCYSNHIHIKMEDGKWKCTNCGARRFPPFEKKEKTNA